MAKVAGSSGPQRDVGASFGTAATEYAADRAVGTPAEGGPDGVAGRSQLNLAFRRFLHHRMALIGLAIFVLLV